MLDDADEMFCTKQCLLRLFFFTKKKDLRYLAKGVGSGFLFIGKTLTCPLLVATPLTHFCHETGAVESSRKVKFRQS